MAIIHAVHITQSGTYYEWFNLPTHEFSANKTTSRLDALAFQPAKEQRKVANRWNHYILGHDYLRNAARLCPQTREWVLSLAALPFTVEFFLLQSKLWPDDVTISEKRRRRNCFSLNETVLGCEYITVKKPVDKRTKEPIEPAHKFEVTLEPDLFTQEKLILVNNPSDARNDWADHRYALYADYQRRVHGENEYSEFSPRGFERFLCSGIKQGYRIVDGQTQKLGSYHQCYRLNGRLIALGVLDLLPNCVSSVYLM